MYFSRNWEFGSDLSKLRNFEGGVEPPNPAPSVLHCVKVTVFNLSLQKIAVLTEEYNVMIKSEELIGATECLTGGRYRLYGV
jgi:hypothetical protein